MTSNALIAVFAYEAWRRHVADCRHEEAAAKRRASVHSRVVADLRHAIALDIEGFLCENGNRPGAALICRNDASPGDSSSCALTMSSAHDAWLWISGREG